MIEIQAPNNILCNYPIIFLAGSVEMGAAENWQRKVITELQDMKGTILNPRRDEWDSSWEQDINNQEFVNQVIWEMNGIMRATHILFHFDPTTKSPISLLELGFTASLRTTDIYISCPEGFWRRGNVQVFSHYFNSTNTVIVAKTLDEAIQRLKLDLKGD